MGGAELRRSRIGVNGLSVSGVLLKEKNNLAKKLNNLAQSCLPFFTSSDASQKAGGANVALSLAKACTV